MFHVGKNFYYRGCGWRPKKMEWTAQDKAWIERMNHLFDDLFGPDVCQFDDTDTKHRILVPGQFPLRIYDHDEWEKTEGKVMVEEGDEYGSTLKQSEDGESVREDAHEENDSTINQSDGTEAVKEDAREEGIKSDDTETVREDAQKREDSAIKQTERKENIESDLKNLTRGELPSLKLPNVSFITESEVAIIRSPATAVQIRNAILATERPCEAILQHASKLLQDSKIDSYCADSEEEDEAEEEVLVNLGRIGCYTKKGIQVFQTMCRLSTEARKVEEERKWLSQPTSVSGVNTIQEVLFNARPNDEVIRHRDFIMDISDFSTLACERYVNGFAMDVASFQFLERTQNEGVVYLPSFSQLWAKQGVEYFKHKLNSIFPQCQLAKATCILTPMHFDRPQHWGLICFDILNRTVFFDDGLKLNPRREMVRIIQNMLCAFSALSDGAIPAQHWNEPSLGLPLPRINMPKQPKSGVGSGSCGVGVILAIRDII